jgi:pyruvate kinase
MRKTKIVCTIGPASHSPEMLEKLMRAGMDVARLNFSHGTHAGHAVVVRRLRALARKLRRPIALLMDLQGPKIRTGRVAAGKAELKAGHPFILTTRPVAGTSASVSTPFKSLPKDLKPGDPVLMDDGRIRLLVEKVTGPDIHCLVQVGGILSDHKGINLPGVRLSSPSLTPKDLADLDFGLSQGVDYVAQSFVRHPTDVLRLKERIAKRGLETPVIAKIEKPEALEQLGGILKAADGIMVARGDLGVELSPEQVPLVQKELITRANQAQLLVITATQMLESMCASPQPTRAEASDVANAIFDGTDAVMLSQETAVGSYPVEAVSMMSRICETAEASWQYAAQHSLANLKRSRLHSIPDTICHAARVAVDDLHVKLVVCFTQSGNTARFLAKYRPEVRIVAYSSSRDTVSRMALYWGTQPRYLPLIPQAERLFREVEKALKKEGSVAAGDTILIVSGTPIGKRGSINLLKAHKIS